MLECIQFIRKHSENRFVGCVEFILEFSTLQIHKCARKRGELTKKGVPDAFLTAALVEKKGKPKDKSRNSETGDILS